MPPWAQRSTPQCPVWRRRATGPRRFFSESGVRRFLPLAQRGIEPGPGKRPVAVGGTADDAQRLGRLVEREPREETELDQLGTGGIYLGQLVQGVVEVEQLVRRFSEGEVE